MYNVYIISFRLYLLKILFRKFLVPIIKKKYSNTKHTYINKKYLKKKFKNKHFNKIDRSKLTINYSLNKLQLVCKGLSGIVEKKKNYLYNSRKIIKNFIKSIYEDF